MTNISNKHSLFFQNIIISNDIYSFSSKKEVYKKYVTKNKFIHY
ncbi:hypothetical protein BMETH_569_1 [methanotrophic bacterial endosymbiont of Bathymodiolus sp.]|jgi:hypothetical protein|nr:hypothetical protein BMETH_569_1 [methanotrophic bacterial endosymbiont of Bathymodiolus sp.]